MPHCVNLACSMLNRVFPHSAPSMCNVCGSTRVDECDDDDFVYVGKPQTPAQFTMECLAADKPQMLIALGSSDTVKHIEIVPATRYDACDPTKKTEILFLRITMMTKEDLEAEAAAACASLREEIEASKR